MTILKEHTGPIYRIINVKNKILSASLDKSYVLWDLEKRDIERIIPNRHHFETGFFPIGDMVFDEVNCAVISVASGDLAFSIVKFILINLPKW